MFLDPGSLPPVRRGFRLRSRPSNRDRLRRAIAAILARDPGLLTRAALNDHLDHQLARVRRLVCAEVIALRSVGMPPERMLVEMKDLLLPLLALGRTRRDRYGPADVFMSQIVRWCAQAYYAPAD